MNFLKPSYITIQGIIIAYNNIGWIIIAFDTDQKQ